LVLVLVLMLAGSALMLMLAGLASATCAAGSRS